MKRVAGIMVAYRLVAIDIDGTLLNERGELTAGTRATLARLPAAGVVLALATSRRLTGTVPVAEAVGVPGPLIVYDGAQIRDYPSRAILAAEALDAAIAQLAVEVLNDCGLRPIVQHGDAEGERLLVGPEVNGYDNEKAYLERFSHQVAVLPLEALCRNQPDPLRVVAFGSLRRLQAAIEAIAALPCGWQLLPQGNYGTAELTIFSPTASKGNGLQRLAKQLDIPLAESLAIGDGINDVSLLSAAGLGVAMGNACREAREVAQVLTASNAEDGAAQAIERYVLGAAEGTGSPAPALPTSKLRSDT